MTQMDTTVDTVEGTVDGKRGRRSRRGTVSWLGIPYAAPPVGPLRLRAPQPVQPWDGVLECFDYGFSPIQDKLFTARADGTFQPRSEDCLTVNVFAPDTVSATPRPVMVFNYGGAYVLGGSSTPIYDGSFLARARDVIVVTVNYRFGPFGFLDLSEYSTPERRFDSNCGLRDMVAALEWVQRNIAAFGGDPDRVTVFGESAGGAAVLTLLSTPAAEGLFSRAIAQSPAAELVVHEENRAVLADEFVRQLENPGRRSGPQRTEPPMSPEKVAALIDDADPYALLAAGNRLLGFTKHAELSDPMPFAPAVDGDYLPLAPVDAARAGTTHRVPLIAGSNRDEGELFARFWSILPEPTHYLVGVHDPEVREELTRLYPGTRDQVRLSADAVFWIPTMIFAENHAKHSPTYVYRYDYAVRALKLTGIGATHATELLAIFGVYRHPIGIGLAAAGSWFSTKRITGTMQSMWTWFARTGVPAENWPRYSADDRRVLVLDHPVTVEDDPDGARRAAWERVHLELRNS
ncbi:MULTISPECIES: carboxylesterase/lipase family protein [unclassified Gordonia (in: high G+C Gram-positive bacteria)]|uniref:carboxylesterase/lipase family protein n=1 Tax=unclassified Gordonia (in: high G+C Gram-positive bacteria) TaxID=2657482 RepID=UPI001FFEBE1E|nr:MULTISPECIES: carboxylesterase/lipase family protein [unclassified Gordonia (in: high G+C Gram-positive bacteria)]UQE74646.1 carboxylesterase/lipase family protein [Gordonia sp. PP30]